MSSVYFIRCKATGAIKIGLSESPWSRLSKMQSDSPGELEMLGVVEGGLVTEAQMHARFFASHLRGEWFNPTADLVAFTETLSAPEGQRKKVYDAATSPTCLATAVGIGKAHASSILSGKRIPSPRVAVRVFRVTGLKLGPIANLTDDEIALLEKMHG